MTTRQNRLNIIKSIIQNQEIGSQEELAQALAQQGLHLAQATMSRDLKLLKVAKVFMHGGTRPIYIMPDHPHYRRVSEHRKQGTAIEGGFISVRFSGQLAVIKCRPGYASGLASDIDGANFQGVIGTIAGDDTIFLALEEGYDRDTLEANLRTIVPVYPGSQQ